MIVISSPRLSRSGAITSLPFPEFPAAACVTRAVPNCPKSSRIEIILGYPDLSARSSGVTPEASTQSTKRINSPHYDIDHLSETHNPQEPEPPTMEFLQSGPGDDMILASVPD